MTYLNYARFCGAVALITLTLFPLPEPALAVLEQAAPYTVEAQQRLDKAALQVPPMLAPRGLREADENTKKTALVKSLYKYMEDLYQAAGYSFEKSFLKLAKDVETDPAFAKNNPQLMLTAFRTSYSVYVQLSGINNAEFIVANYLPRPAGEAFAKMIRIEGEQREIAEDREAFENAMRAEQTKNNRELQAESDLKQKEAESAARQKAIEDQIETERLVQERRAADQALRDKEKQLAANLNLVRLQGIAGRYVSASTRNNKPLAEMEISVNAAGSVLLNGHDNEYGGDKSPKPNCQFNDVSLHIKSISGKRVDLTFDDAQAPSCEVTLVFEGSGMHVYNTGGKQCPSHCKSPLNIHNNSFRGPVP
jgi:hypothetical protein